MCLIVCLGLVACLLDYGCMFACVIGSLFVCVRLYVCSFVCFIGSSRVCVS